MNRIEYNIFRKRFLLIVMIFMIFACAPRAGIISKSDPEIVSLNRDGYTISVEAIKKDFIHYNMFRVVITNTGDLPLSIDWNKSRWLINGKNGGKFIFKGIDPGAIKEDKVKDTLVTPGQAAKVEIAPFRLIAWEPLRYKTNSNGETISAGMLPKGNHGIYLVLKQNEKVFKEKLEISILHEPVS